MGALIGAEGAFALAIPLLAGARLGSAARHAARHRDDAAASTPLHPRPPCSEGAAAALQDFSRGVGVVLGPIALGDAIDAFHNQFSSAHGYAAMCR